MPFDATHIVFARDAAQAVDPRLLRPELLTGAIAPDSVGSARFLPMARSHLKIREAARAYARSGADAALRAFSFGYLSHVWMDRFVARWYPRHPIVLDGRRLELNGLYPLLARRDAEAALGLWRDLGFGTAPVDPSACRFVDPAVLDAYRAGVEARLLAAPPLGPDESAPAIMASERTRTAAVEGFARRCRATDPRMV